MPKIINHDDYRRSLAEQAAGLFSKHGYAGLGMRKIAAELGLSKSALYHYFPTKRDLFLASTDVVTRREAQAGRAESLPDVEPSDAIMAMIRDIEPGFSQEMVLLFDYLRGMSADDIAKDPVMVLASERYLTMLTGLVASDKKKPVFAYMLGVLLLRYLDGNQTDFEDFVAELKQLIQD